MMRMMRKAAVIFAVMLVVTVAVAQAETSGDWTYSIYDGKATVTAYTGTEAGLVIPDSLGGYPVVSVGGELCRQNKGITSVVFPDSVESIGSCVFAWCKELESVVLPENLRTIGVQAFFNCEKLKDVDLPQGLEEIGTSAFALCHELTGVLIPASVQKIGGGAFCGCDSLKSIAVAEENESYVSADGVLYTKDGKRIVCYPADKPGETYSIPVGTEVIGMRAFQDANHLEHVTIPEGIVRLEDSAFSVATGIKALELPQSLTYIGVGAFYGAGIRSLVIPDSVEVIEDQAFRYSHLTSVTLPAGLSSIEEHLFSLCSGLEAVDIPQSVTRIGQLAFYGCGKLTSLELPEGVESIDYQAFANCRQLAHILIPQSVTSIDKTAFNGCEELVASVYEGSYAHQWCEQNGVAYVLIAMPEDPSEEIPDEDILSGMPETGDKSALWLWLVLAAVAAAAILLIRKKKS